MKQLSFFDNPMVVFKEDDFILCSDFKKGTEWFLYDETSTHYIIFHNDIYYHPFKSKCEKVGKAI